MHGLSVSFVLPGYPNESSSGVRWFYHCLSHLLWLRFLNRFQRSEISEMTVRMPDLHITQVLDEYFFVAWLVKASDLIERCVLLLYTYLKLSLIPCQWVSGVTEHPWSNSATVVLIWHLEFISRWHWSWCGSWCCVLDHSHRVSANNRLCACHFQLDLFPEYTFAMGS